MSFLDTMPPAVARQRDLLRRLLDVLEPDPAWRWLELSCSLARGVGDELSDVDCGAGTSGWPDVLSTVDSLVRGLGPAVDVLHQPFGENARHTFVQYADGLQLSFVVMPADQRPGLPPSSVALLDKDGRLAAEWLPASHQATADQVREWLFLGWIALADLVKYLRRGSLWEAHARLEEARTQAFRIWAADNGAAYPSFGLTSILDAPGLVVPAGAAETVADLNADDLLRAARCCAQLLRTHGNRLPMGDYVQGLLDQRNSSTGIPGN